MVCRKNVGSVVQKNDIFVHDFADKFLVQYLINLAADAVSFNCRFGDLLAYHDSKFWLMASIRHEEQKSVDSYFLRTSKNAVKEPRGESIFFGEHQLWISSTVSTLLRH